MIRVHSARKNKHVSSRRSWPCMLGNMPNSQEMMDAVSSAACPKRNCRPSEACATVPTAALHQSLSLVAPWPLGSAFQFWFW